MTKKLLKLSVVIIILSLMGFTFSILSSTANFLTDKINYCIVGFCLGISLLVASVVMLGNES